MDLSKLTPEEKELLARAYDGEALDLSSVPADRKVLLADAWDAFGGEAASPAETPEQPTGWEDAIDTWKDVGSTALKALDLPSGVLRTGYLAAQAEPGKRLDSAKDSLDSLLETGYAPSTGSTALDIGLDPAMLLGGAGLLKAGIKAGAKAAPALMRQAFRPAATKLAEDTGKDLGGFLARKGFKGSSAGSAKKFVQEVADDAIKQREAISMAASGAKTKAAIDPLEGAFDVVRKATAEGDDVLASQLRQEAERLMAKPKNLEQLEAVKRGLNRKITDAARNPNVGTSMQQQFWKSAVSDIDDQIMKRLPEAQRDIYKQLGQDTSFAIKAKKPLAKLASKSPISQVDLMLAGAGGAASYATNDPSYLAALALKKGLTSPAIMTSLARAAPAVGGVAAPAAGLSIYKYLQEQNKGAQK